MSVADHLDAKLTARQRAAAIMKQVDAAQRNSETVAGIFVSYIAARKAGTEVDRRHAKDVAAMAGSMPAFRNLPPRHVVGALDTAEVTRHAAGAVIHHEGDRGDALCVVVGAVERREVDMDGWHALKRYGSGCARKTMRARER